MAWWRPDPLLAHPPPTPPTPNPPLDGEEVESVRGGGGFFSFRWRFRIRENSDEGGEEGR